MVTEEELGNIQVICNRLSEKKVGVTPSQLAYTDGKTIYLPLRSDTYSDNKGFAGHESMHIRAGSFKQILEDCISNMQYRLKIDYSVCRYIVNITEDFRVNQWLKLAYEGFYENLNDAEERLIKDNWSKKQLTVIEEIGLVFLNEETVNKYIKLSILTDAYIKKIRAVKEALLDNLSAEQSIKAAWDIAEIYCELRDEDLKNKQNKQNKQNDQNNQKSNQNNQDQEGGKNQSSESDSSESDSNKSDSNNQSGGGKSEDNNESTENSSSQTKSNGSSQKSGSGGSGGNMGDLEEEINLDEDFEFVDEMDKFLDDVDGDSGISDAEKKTNHDVSYDLDNARGLSEDDPKQNEVSGVANESDVSRAKELRKALNKVKMGQMTDEDLKKAAEKAKKDIEKILNQGKDKGSFTSDDGNKCKRITDKKQVVGNSKGCDYDLFGVRTTLTDSSFKAIISRNKGLINKLKSSLAIRAERSITSRGHIAGRLNRDVVRYVASGYEYTSCFSRTDIKTKGKMMILMDLSSSMSGNRIKNLKESVVVILKALENSTDLRVVGYTGGSNGAVTIVFKEFGEKMDVKKIDAIGLRREGGGTPTAIAVETELHFLTSTQGCVKNRIPVILLTDGEPNDYEETVRVFKKLKKQVRIYGVGLGCGAGRMGMLFGKDYVMVNRSTELKGQLIALAKKIVKGFKF